MVVKIALVATLAILTGPGMATNVVSVFPVKPVFHVKANNP